MKFNQIFLLLTLLMVSGCVSLTYADYRDEVSARQAILDLKEGALIVRFYSQEKTLNEIDRLMSTDISASNKDKLQRKKDGIIADRLKNYKKIHSTIKQYYSFCPVYYINDYDMISFNETGNADLLLNENMEKDNSISFGHEKYFYLAMGDDQFDYIILDKSGLRVAAPFPSRLYVSGMLFSDMLGAIFGRDKFVVAFGKLEKDLSVYYNKVTTN